MYHEDLYTDKTYNIIDNFVTITTNCFITHKPMRELTSVASIIIINSIFYNTESRNVALLNNGLVPNTFNR